MQYLMAAFDLLCSSGVNPATDKSKPMRRAISKTLLSAILCIGLLAPVNLEAKEAKAQPKPAVAAPVATPTPAPKPAPTPWLYENSDIPVDTSWTFGTLENGLRYAVKKNDVPAGQVAIRVRIDAGALNEEDNERGFAHLIEHLSFRGSTFVPDGEAKRIWQRFGVSFGSDSNAQTTATQTAYILDLPNATPAALDESVKILSGMMRAPRITEAALKAEQAIVLAEMREGSGAQARFSDHQREHFFQGQRLANRPTIGTAETLQAVTAPALTAFHNRWYRPENTVVVMAGDIDPAKLVALIKANFSDWKGKGPFVPAPDFGSPTKTEKVTRVVNEPTIPLMAQIGYVRPWKKVDDTIVYNQQMLADQLALKMINRRLEEAARNGGSFLRANVSQDKISRTGDTVLIAITPMGNQWQTAIADVRAVIADATTTPPSLADITREKKLFADVLRTLKNSYPFEAASKQADDIVQAVDIRETVATPDTVVSVFEGMQARVTPQWMLESTQKLFAGAEPRILLSLPKNEVGAEKKLAEALSAPVVANGKLRLAESDISFDALPKFGPAGKVTATRTVPRLDVEQIQLSNGVRAQLYANKAENDQVRILVRFGKGYQSVSPNAPSLLWAGEYVLSENGIGKLRLNQIEQMINGRRIDLSFGIDSDAFQFSAVTRPEDLADQLKLIAAKIEFPGWDPLPVERMKAEAIAGYDSYKMSAMTMVQRDLEYLLSSRDPRWKSPDPAEINKLTAKSFEDYWKPLMASGSIEVSVFGDFERAAAVAALEQTFGAMAPRKDAVAAPLALAKKFPAAASLPKALSHQGPSDQAAALIAWPTGGGLAKVTESRELEVLATIFRDRLFEKFRAEQAASYSPDMNSNWPLDFSSGGYLMAYAQVKPEDVNRFYAFADEVANDLMAKPIEADELKRAIEPIKQSIERAASGNSFWLSQLKGASIDPARITALTHLYSDFAQVTPQRLQALAKQYFVTAKAWKLVVQPEKVKR
jgi:zinc protease